MIVKGGEVEWPPISRMLYKEDDHQSRTLLLGELRHSDDCLIQNVRLEVAFLLPSPNATYRMLIMLRG